MGITIEDLVAIEKRLANNRAGIREAQDAPGPPALEMPMGRKGRRAKAPQRSSYQPQVVIAWMREVGIANPHFEFRFHPSRKWRFDLAWPASRVAVEIQGGLFTKGRHTQGAALLKEQEKLNMAAVMGWRILYVIPAKLMTAGFARLVRVALSPEDRI